MQTFLPYPDFEKTAKCLDYKRLGKQRVEAYQILRILLNISPKTGWRNHPAVLMWKEYEWSLADYGLKMCYEWKKRGYRDNLSDYFLNALIKMANGHYLMTVPSWIGNRNFHLSHQSNLVRKLPEHYKKYFPDVPNDLLYYWPTKNNAAFHELRRVT